MSTENNYAFGSFILRTDPLRLLRDGTEVALGSRALAILHALIRHPGQALTKQRLIELVWSGGPANDNSVHVHINTLRNRIGHELIVTVAGAGYRLNAPVRPIGRAAAMPLGVGSERRLLGRDAEATELAELIACRSLVTVTGPGGCGKSALTLALAASSALHTDVAYVDVAALDDSAQIAAAVARAVGIEPPSAGAELQWRMELGARDVLLLLDNCERHVAAVADLCAGLALALGGLRILATSQVPLQIAGEWTLRLAGLPVPLEGATPAVAGEYSSVRLLVERAAQQRRGFALTADNVALIVNLVRLADGMPLAIELMAQRVEDTGNDAAALGRLLIARNASAGLRRRDAPLRHQSLHAALQWSLGLLGAEEREALTQLAVFDEGFTAAAAAAVVAPAAAADADADADAMVHALLTTLVRRSLLLVDWGGPRYRLVHLVRAQLLADGTDGAARAALDGARRRHAQYYAEHARDLRHDYAQRGSNPAAWREHVERELGNLQAALDWAIGTGRSAELALKLSADLAAYWDMTGRPQQAAAPIAAALRLPASSELRPLRVGALEAGAACELHRGSLQSAAQLYEEAGVEARALGAEAALHRAALGKAACGVLLGDATAAQAALQSAVAGFEALRDRDGLAACHDVQALIGIERDDVASALGSAEQALDAARSGGALTTAADAHALLGQVLVLAGDAPAARSHLQAAIDLASYLGFERPRLQAACVLASVNAAMGERSVASRQLAGALHDALQSDMGGLVPAAVLTAAGLMMDGDAAADALSLVCAVEAAVGRGTAHLPPWLRRQAADLQQRAMQKVDAAQVEVARTHGRAMNLLQAGWQAVAALQAQGGNVEPMAPRRRARRAAPADEELRERAAGER